MFDLNFWLWAAQIVLALLFGFAGQYKALTAREKMAANPGMDWSRDFPLWLVRFIGVVEVAGAVGMILPIVTDILPWLTPLAAIGFVVIQVLGMAVHARRGETAKTLPVNLALTALSVFVVWGRFDLF